MSMFYSVETGGFYHPNIHQNIPVDAIEIPARRHKELLDGLATGQVIAIEAGEAYLAAPPPPSWDQMLSNLRSQRDKLLSASDHKMMPDYPASEAEREAWRLYRQQLRDLPETITNPVDVIWPEPPTGDSN